MELQDKTTEAFLNELQDLRQEVAYLKELNDKDHSQRIYLDEALGETKIKLKSALDN